MRLCNYGASRDRNVDGRKSELFAKKEVAYLEPLSYLVFGAKY
jgi:hypothetical protein